MDKGKNLFNSLLGIFNKLSLQQKLFLSGIIVISLVLLGFVFFIFNEPNYTTLYSNLSQEDASQVIEYLTNEKVPYKIGGNGSTILVAKDKVYKVRLTLAGKGIPSSGTIGYEIFDHNTMGMSEFMQKINYKRALEGEIARTIMQQNGVKSARVHIVIPQKTIFKDEEKPPTASVVLKLKPGVTLSANNVIAIENLVAGSVEGLVPNKVTVIDTRGRMLSKHLDDNPMAINGNKQYEIKTSIENYLRSKAQGILNKVVGYGNSDVQVNVELNFNQVEKTLESYDPESQVAVSEQSIKSQSNGISVSDSNAVISENTTTNYEISKSIEKIIESAGNIKRITVAAVINGVTKQITNGGKTETVNEPRPQEQLQKLEQLLRQAVGIDNTRKDQISIVSIPFEMPEENLEEDTGSPLNNIGNWFNYILTLLGLVAAGFVLKGLLKKLKNEKIMIGTSGFQDKAFGDLAAASSAGGLAPPTWTPERKAKNNFLDIGDLEDELTDEAAQRQMKQEKIVNYVSKNPSEAAKLINSWLREDEFE